MTPIADPDLSEALDHAQARDLARFFLKSVIDGDTIRGSILLPCGLAIPDARIRIHGIDAPELRSSNHIAAEASKARLIDILDHNPIVLQFIPNRTDAWGRDLATVWVNVDAFWQDAGQLLIQEGHAVPYIPPRSRNHA